MKRLSLLAIAVASALPSLAHADWRSEADLRIERLRKGDFSVELRGKDGAPLKAAQVEYQLKRHDFLFGTAIAYAPFTDGSEAGKQYRRFILDNFNAVVCENAMKWSDNEPAPGQEDYSRADALLAFAVENGLRMRGHCLFWEKQKHVQPWLIALDPIQLQAAVERRLASAVPRYAGKLVSWDVDNEMLDGSFYRERLGAEARALMFREAARLDPKTPLFVNEYGILGDDDKIERYVALVRNLRNDGARVGGIGVQAHDCERLVATRLAAAISSAGPEAENKSPLTPLGILSTFNRLYAETGLPIHITEVSARVADPVARGEALETLLRVGFSHQAVQAIMLWGFGEKTHWMGPDAALVNADGTLNPAGQRISRLLREEWTARGSATAGPDGRISFRGFFGTYALKITLPDGRQVTQEIPLTKAGPKGIVQVAE
jgi:endo-1,4-beta-xylanase